MINISSQYVMERLLNLPEEIYQQKIKCIEYRWAVDQAKLNLEREYKSSIAKSNAQGRYGGAAEIEANKSTDGLMETLRSAEKDLSIQWAIYNKKENEYISMRKIASISRGEFE